MNSTPILLHVARPMPMKKGRKIVVWTLVLSAGTLGLAWSAAVLRTIHWAAITPGTRQYEFGWVLAAVVCLMASAISLLGTVELSERAPEEVSPESAWPTAFALSAPFLMGFVVCMVLAFVDLVHVLH